MIILPQININNAANSDNRVAVKVVFAHHSTGGNLIADTTGADGKGGLGKALNNAGYFLSDTCYEWDAPNNIDIGSYTDIGHWHTWFSSADVMSAVYTRYDKDLYSITNYGDRTRSLGVPEGENRVIIIKSCYPNSEVYSDNDTVPADLYGHAYDHTVGGQRAHTLSNCKAVYEQLYAYMAGHTEKMYVIVINPPLSSGNTTSERAANMRALAVWLRTEWLQGHSWTNKNIYIYDMYNVLTDADNHHSVQSGVEYHHTEVDSDNYLVYPSADDHPSGDGNRKITSEFVPLLNLWYNTYLSSAELIETNFAGSLTAIAASFTADAIVDSIFAAALQQSTASFTSNAVIESEINAQLQQITAQFSAIAIGLTSFNAQSQLITARFLPHSDILETTFAAQADPLTASFSLSAVIISGFSGVPSSLTAEFINTAILRSAIAAQLQPITAQFQIESLAYSAFAAALVHGPVGFSGEIIGITSFDGQIQSIRALFRSSQNDSIPIVSQKFTVHPYYQKRIVEEIKRMFTKPPSDIIWIKIDWPKVLGFNPGTIVSSAWSVNGSVVVDNCLLQHPFTYVQLSGGTLYERCKVTNVIDTDNPVERHTRSFTVNVRSTPER